MCLSCVHMHVGCCLTCRQIDLHLLHVQKQKTVTHKKKSKNTKVLTHNYEFVT